MPISKGIEEVAMTTTLTIVGLFVFAIFLWILKRKNLAKRTAAAREREQGKNFWTQVVGEPYDPLHHWEPKVDNWKKIQVLQPKVDEIFKARAAILQLACDEEKAFMDDVKERRCTMDSQERLKHLHTMSLRVENAKNAFWGFHAQAKKFGFSVKESFKEYL